MENKVISMDVIIRDGLWGFIVGDAMGAAVEFGERWMRDLDPVKEMRSGGMFEVPIGGWTDDTSMVLATFHSLQAGYDPKDMMNRFDVRSQLATEMAQAPTISGQFS